MPDRHQASHNTAGHADDWDTDPGTVPDGRSRLSRADQLDLIRAEQKRGWAVGSPFLVESYRNVLERVGAGPEDWLDLIVHEMLLRQENGDPFTEGEYVERFPAFAARIRDQFAFLALVRRDRM